MHPKTRLAWPLPLLIGLVAVATCPAQTPDEAAAWERQRLQAAADEQVRAEQLNRDRASRRADPMAWVRTLDPMSAGGWEFRGVAADGSWAAYSTTHQMRRAGALVTVWLRQEYAEPQTGSAGRYSSAVEKIQYDCDKERARPLLVIYYSANNIQGTEQSEELDPKTAVWNPIVPGTREETNFLWACAAVGGRERNRPRQ